MKHRNKIIILLAALGLLTGCGSDKGTSTPTATTQPDVTITIPDVEPTPDNTTTTRAPITVTTSTRVPIVTTTSTTRAPIIRGVCGTEVNTCKSGRLVDLPDTLSSHSWACRGTSTFVSCSQYKPLPILGTGSVKLMIGSIDASRQVARINVSDGYQDITLVNLLSSLFCINSSKARFRELMKAQGIPLDFWGGGAIPGPEKFCGGLLQSLVNKTSKITLAVGTSSTGKGGWYLNYVTLDGDDSRKIHLTMIVDRSGRVYLNKLIKQYRKYRKSALAAENKVRQFDSNGNTITRR